MWSLIFHVILFLIVPKHDSDWMWGYCQLHIKFSKQRGTSVPFLISDWHEQSPLATVLSSTVPSAVKVVEGFFNVIEVTQGDGLTFKAWSDNMVATCVEASEDELTIITPKLLALCEVFNGIKDFGVMANLVAKCIGDWAVEVVKEANRIVTSCVSEFLIEMVRKCESKLLRQQEFFKTVCDAKDFLPTEARSSFWEQCAQFPLPEELRASVSRLHWGSGGMFAGSMCSQSAIAVGPY